MVVSITCLFSPRSLGKWSNLTHIFEMGWNHQPENIGKLLDPTWKVKNGHMNKGKWLGVIRQGEITWAMIFSSGFPTTPGSYSPFLDIGTFFFVFFNGGKKRDEKQTSIWSNYSDPTRPISPKWWFSKGNPLISGKSRLVKYYNLARSMEGTTKFILTLQGGSRAPIVINGVTWARCK